jgi:hypothetical protein
MAPKLFQRPFMVSAYFRLKLMLDGTKVVAVTVPVLMRLIPH